MKPKIRYLMSIFTLLLILLWFSPQGFCYSFGGRIFIDTNDDGIYNVGEGVNGVEVTLWEYISGSWQYTDCKNNYGGEHWFVAGADVYQASNLTFSDGAWGYGTLYSGSSYKLEFDLTGLGLAGFDSTQEYITNGDFSIVFNTDTGFTDSFNLLSNEYGLNAKALATVPEPGTMLLFGLGLVGLAGGIRRKKTDKGC